MGEIQGIARFKIHEGKLEEWKRLVAGAMETVRSKDSGTLQYDLFLSDDSSEGVLYERYRDSDALLEHFANLGDTMNALLQTYSSISGEILGRPNAESREGPRGCRRPNLRSVPVDVGRLAEAAVPRCSRRSCRELPISTRRSPSDLGRSMEERLNVGPHAPDTRPF